MSSAAVSFWRTAGMTYLAYANTCAGHLRACLKEPFRTQVASREQVHYKIAKWKEGVQEKAVVREMLNTGAKE